MKVMRSIWVVAVMTISASAGFAQPQQFSSGSTGADGALNYAQNLGTVYFPPAGVAQRANNIYNFTTITIGSGTTVRLSGWVINGPVYWLAQGNVSIAGTLDLSGQPGHAPSNPSLRAPSEPGAGGYSGGVAYVSASQPATAGNGPGGGALPPLAPADPATGNGGSFSGSSYLQPLVGGSGGSGGGVAAAFASAGGGGAGGGAILIASSTQITVSGGINASGGNSGAAGGRYGGAGSGGAVRLVSNTLNITGTVTVAGGIPLPNSTGDGAFPGIARYEAYTLTGTGAIASPPYNLSLPVGGPSTVTVTSVNGVAINANPFSFPDATINTGSAVPVVISGANVPPGTTGKLYVFSENAADQVVPFTLNGTLQATSATVNVAYATGGSRGFAKAVWTSQ